MSDNTAQVLALTILSITFILTLLLTSGDPDLIDGLVYMTGVTK